MYIGMIETRSLKMLLKSFHGNYSDQLKKITWYKVYKVLGAEVFCQYVPLPQQFQTCTHFGRK